MKLKNLIKDKLIIKQKTYIRFSNLKKETKQVLVDNNNNLILKKMKTSSNQLGFNDYSTLYDFKYKNLKELKLIKSMNKNTTELPYISTITNALKNNSRSLIVIKPVKSGYITMFSNGLIGFISKSNIVSTLSTLYKVCANSDQANYLLKSTGQYKNAYDFFKIKALSKIKTIHFKFKVKKNSKKNTILDKTTNLKIIVDNFYNKN